MHEVQSIEILDEYIFGLDNNQTFSYRAWQSSGIPCDHVLIILAQNPQIYVKSFFTFHAYVERVCIRNSLSSISGRL